MESYQAVFNIFLITLIVIVTTTKIGFMIQKVYVDIKAIIPAVAIAILIGMIFSNIPLLGLFIGYVVLIELLTRMAKVKAMPDALFATVIGIGLQVIILINYYGEISALI